MVFKNVWTSTSPNSEFIVEVKLNVVDCGFVNIFEKIIDELFPLVVVLLS